VPEEFLPAHGSITALEVPRGAVTEIDAAIGALIGQLPATLAFAGEPVEVPAGFSFALQRSGPWRFALWREGSQGGGPGESRFVLFVGGEAFARVRGRLAAGAARRLDGREGLAAVAAGGGLLVGDDRELVRECARRAEGAARRAIPRDGVRFWRDDADLAAAVELWWAPSSEGDLLLVRWRGPEDAIAWREWFLDHGVDVAPLEESGGPPGERRYEIHGAREALSEWIAELGRW